MSHLKLQKLLYYTQALHLAYFDSELIEDDFEAWVHGPVSRKVFNTVRDHSILHGEIAYTQESDEQTPDVIINKSLIQDQIDLINEVLSEYSKLTPLQLENLSHSESPWINARKGLPPSDRCTNIIPKEEMKVYYKQAVYGEQS